MRLRYKVRKLKRNWCENELKLFFVVESYPTLYNFLRIQELGDWETISSIFVNKKVDDCKFEWLSLLKVGPPNEDWKEQEDKLLEEIISKQLLENKWNDVAKELYRESEQQYFRRPKQCRERWRNYLDPDISKGDWTPAEDNTLLEYVLEIGKKWSAIAKCIRKRTEHAVKNRFKSLIKKYRKDNPKRSRKGKGADSQSDIIKNILKNNEQSQPESEVSAVQQNLPEKKKERPLRAATKPSKPASQKKQQAEFKEQLPKSQKQQVPIKFPGLLPTPRQFTKQDFNANEMQWMCSPMTPWNYLDKGKQFSNLVMVTSPRSTLSPRFRSLGWPDLDKDHFI